jgi:hypothetical protein
VPYDLLKRGYDNQLCLDFSSIVVDLMRSRHASEAGVEWTNGDVRDMKDIESKSIDVAFDKGTLDAMIFGSPWSPPDEVTENSGKYMNEVSQSIACPLTSLYVKRRSVLAELLTRSNECSRMMASSYTLHIGSLISSSPY